MKDLLMQATAALAQGNLSLAYDFVQSYLIAEIEGEKQEKEQDQLLFVALGILEQGDFQARWEMAKVLPNLGDRIIDPLITVIENEENESEYRWFAARILGGFDQPRIVLALVKLLETTEDEDLKAIASSSLGNLGKSAIAVLSELLSNAQTRLLAVEALAQIRRTEVIEPLLTIINDADANVRKEAIAALGSFSDARILPLLIISLKDLAAPVRKEAIIALGFRADPGDKTDLLNELEPLLYDYNLEVCQQAAIAISKIKVEKGAMILFKILQEDLTPIPLQLTLIQSLAWLETPVSVSYLDRALTNISSDRALEIIRVLGRIEILKTEAADILLKFFNSDSPLLQQPQIRQAIAYSWGQLKVSQTLNALETLTHDPESVVKLHAIAALKKLQTNPKT